MTASLSRFDEKWLINCTSTQKLLSEDDTHYVCAQFDADAKADVPRIMREMQEIKFLRKVCLLKVATFWPEYLLTKVLFGEPWSTYKKDSFELYYSFYRKKISFDTFRLKMQDLMQNGELL